MIIGCPKEVKSLENRVALIPSSVKSLVKDGHTVLIEHNAGMGSGIKDEEFIKAGAQIIDDQKALWEQAQIITKIKEPLEQEFKYFKENHILYTFLHLAAEETLTSALIEKGVTSIAYETIEENNELPILKPMSEVAGRMSVQVGAWCLENTNGGKGLLMSGVPGVKKAKVIILGAGVVGRNAAKIALGMGASVTMLDINQHKLEQIDDIFLGKVQTIYSNDHTVEEEVSRADLVVGAVLVTGARAPMLVNKNMIKNMEQGSVVVDVAVDQGGCIETVHRTTHDDPTYLVDGVVHYGVANMPGAVAKTSTFALAHATLPYLRQIANQNFKDAISASRPLALGVNTYKGHVVKHAVAEALSHNYTNLFELI